MTKALDLFQRIFHHVGLALKALAASHNLWTSSPLAAGCLGFVTAFAVAGLALALSPNLSRLVERLAANQVGSRVVGLIRSGFAGAGAVIAAGLGIHGFHNPQDCVDLFIALGYAAEAYAVFPRKSNDSDWSDWII